jgi:hypothetical protein
MQPLGSAALMEAYHARLSESHDYDITIDVLKMDETPIGPARLVDGQINIQRAADVRRTATLTLLDPDHGLNLDGNTIFEGALFADRMVRVQHHVEVPDFGVVTSTPFVGPITKLNRNGATIDVECQDKTLLGILGTKPYTVGKGMNSVDAIVAIMRDTTGERHFRVPSGSRIRLNRAYSVAWPDEAAPWRVVSQIAWAAGMQVFYSCDGFLTVRPALTQPVLEFGGTGVPMTSAVAGDSDFSSVVNYARTAAGKIVRVAQAPADHPFYPGDATIPGLGRNGVARYMPALADLDEPERPAAVGRKASKAQKRRFAREMELYYAELKSTAAQAQATSNSLLAAGLPMNANFTWSAVPVFHLDVDDPVRLTTPEGTTVLPFAEASIPLVSGDMSGGLLKKVSRPQRLRR